MLCMTRVMKENLKSEKICALNEAKVMLSSVKEYYTKKLTFVRRQSVKSQMKIPIESVDSEHSQKFSSNQSSSSEDRDEIDVRVKMKQKSSFLPPINSPKRAVNFNDFDLNTENDLEDSR